MMKIMWWWWRWCDDDEMMMWWRWWEWRRWWWRGWRWWWCSSSNRLLSSRSFSLLRCYESSRAASAERRAVIGWRGAACARTEPLVDRGRAAAGAWGAAGVVCSMSSCRRAWSICARTDSDSSARFTANIRSARASSSPQHRSHCWEDTDFICTPRHRESVRSAQQRWHTRTHTHIRTHTHTDPETSVTPAPVRHRGSCISVIFLQPHHHHLHIIVGDRWLRSFSNRWFVFFDAEAWWRPCGMMMMMVMMKSEVQLVCGDSGCSVAFPPCGGPIGGMAAHSDYQTAPSSTSPFI